MGEAISRIESGDNDIYSNHPIQPEKAKKYKFPDTFFSYGNVDAIMYALGGESFRCTSRDLNNGTIENIQKYLVLVTMWWA